MHVGSKKKKMKGSHALHERIVEVHVLYLEWVR